MKHRIFPAIALLSLFGIIASQTQAAEDALRMGISGFALPEHRAQIVEATEQALRPLFGDGRLVVRNYPVSDLEEAVQRGEVDIILSSAGLARRVTNYGVRPLVTITSPGLEDPNRNEGSLIVVRDDSRFQTLEDLRGASVSANIPWGFSGWLIAMGEIAATGHDPEKFFGEKVFLGRSAAMVDVVSNVLSRRTDVGILRLCAYESLKASDPKSVEGLRVINEQQQTATACRTSTQLYPAQSLSVTPRVDSLTARDMTMRLLEMPPTESGHSWSIASDFQHVDELLRTLKLGPYQYLREWSLKRFLSYAWPWLMLVAALVAGLFWHSRRTDRLLQIRGELLRKLFERESEQNRKLAFLQRANTINQISSMVAHELRQPLAALTFYADGLGMMLDMGKTDEEKLRRFSNGISIEAARASAIIDSVRAYAKNTQQPRSVVVLADILREAATLFQSSRRIKITVETVLPEREIGVKGNPLELTLVFVNLLKNAAEAAEHVRSPKIRLETALSADSVRISVYDNGPGLSDPALAQLGEPVASEKPDGLGLGLSIARTITEAHGGHLSFERSQLPNYSGLCAEVILPIASETQESSHD